MPLSKGRLAPHQQAPHLTALDFSPAMLRKASQRCNEAKCKVQFVHEDAARMLLIPSDKYDWVVAFFLCCVLPEDLQDQAISEFVRVLKPGGRFAVSDVVTKGEIQPEIRKSMLLWVGCVAGALTLEDGLSLADCEIDADSLADSLGLSDAD